VKNSTGSQPASAPIAAMKSAGRAGSAKPTLGRSAGSDQRDRGILSPAQARWLAIVLVIALPIAALWPLCAHSFTAWDDNSTVADNPSLNPVTVHSLHTWWTTTRKDLYVPVTYTVWGTIALFAHLPRTATTPSYLNPVPFHTANLVLHVLCCIVVFELLRLLIGKTWPAAVGALIFGLHPVQVEAVAWVSGLKDVLGGLLALVAIWQYLVAVKKNQARQSAHWHYAIATAAFILSMLAKPTESITPLLAGLIDVALMHRPWRRSLFWLWPWLVLSAACVVEAKLVQPVMGTPRNVEIVLRPLVAIASVGFYLRKLLLPVNLCVDYGLRPILAIHSPWLVADAVMLITGGTVLWLVRRWARPLALGAVFFLVALAPVLGFVTFDFQWYSTVADHYLYVPMFGVALMAAWIVGRYRSMGVAIGAAGIIGVLATTSYFQTRYWAGTSTLFYHVIDVNPDSAPAYHQLAMIAIDQENYPAAEALSKASIRLRPEAPLGYISLGMALWHMNHKEAAAQQYSNALHADGSQDSVEAVLEDLAGVEAELKHFSIAENLQREVVARNPTVADAHFDLGSILERENKLPEALRELQTAAALNPNIAKFHILLAQTLAEAGQRGAALDQYNVALQLNPDSPAAQMGRQQLHGAGPK
jgi:tetratricopeptide (TPR) repeat protein